MGIRSRFAFLGIAIALSAVAWSGLAAAVAQASTSCSATTTTASVTLDEAAGTPAVLSQDASNNLLVDGTVCGSFGTLTNIDLSVQSGAPAQTLDLDQTGAGGKFPCTVEIEGTLRSEDEVEVQGTASETITVGDTGAGTGVDLDSCGSAGEIDGAGGYDLVAGSGSVVLSAAGGTGGLTALSGIPVTFAANGAGSNTFAAGESSATVDFSNVATSSSAKLTVNVSGGPNGPVQNDTATAGSSTYTFTSGAAEFRTFDASSTGYTDFLAGNASKTFADPAGTGTSDEIDFSNVTTSSSLPLVVNVSGATDDGVSNDTASVGTTTFDFTSGGAAFTQFSGADYGYNHSSPAPTAATRSTTTTRRTRSTSAPLRRPPA